MRLRSSLLIPLLAAAPPLAAQTLAHHGWRLGAGVDALRFSHVAVGGAAPGVAVELRPSGRSALHLTVGRSAGPWDISLEVGWAEGDIEAGNDAFALRDLTAEVTRYRVSPAVGRELRSLGPGLLTMELAPTLDLWSVSGDGRLRAGVEGRVVLRVPLGSVDLEHRLGFGLSASPIETADVGEVADERGLRTLLIGLGVRTRL